MHRGSGRHTRALLLRAQRLGKGIPLLTGFLLGFGELDPQFLDGYPEIRYVFI